MLSKRSNGAGPVVLLLSTYDEDEFEFEGSGAAAYVTKAAFGPERLAIAYKAFDSAWEQIAGEHGTDPNDIEAARTRLANIVLRIAKENDADSVEEMTEVAVDVMRTGP